MRSKLKHAIIIEEEMRNGGEAVDAKDAFAGLDDKFAKR